MATWPTSLPTHPKLRGYAESAETNVIRTPNELGPAKLRSRYTTSVKLFSMSLVMTAAQFATFETFYESTISYGAESFDWVHPRTRAAATCRIKTVPSYTPQGRNVWVVSFQMEIIP